MQGPKTTREALLDAAWEELETYGPSKFRIQRVASRAHLTPTAIYTHFTNREGLIAAATARRAEGSIEAWLKPAQDSMPDSPSHAEILLAFRQLLSGTQDPDRRQTRLDVLEEIAFARYSGGADREVSGSWSTMNKEFIGIAAALDELDLLADGITPVIFARFWFSLLFGQVICDLDDTFEVPPEQWVDALMVAGASLLRPDPSEATGKPVDGEEAAHRSS